MESIENRVLNGHHVEDERRSTGDTIDRQVVDAARRLGGAETVQTIAVPSLACWVPSPSRRLFILDTNELRGVITVASRDRLALADADATRSFPLRVASRDTTLQVAEMTEMMAGIAARDGGVPSQGSAPPREIAPTMAAQA